jgi:NADPH2:quinone reductase
MKAVRIHETGSPEVLQLDELEIPVPGPGEVLIRVGVAGVNFTDVMARQGM